MLKKAIILMLLVIPGLLFSQRSTGTTKSDLYTLRVKVNVPNYRFVVDNKVIKGNEARVTSGSHTIVVSANGYETYKRTIKVVRNTTVNVNLKSSQYQLTISSNVPGKIYLNNRHAANDNFASSVAPGTYSVRIVANGYQDYNTTIVVDRDINIFATMIPNMADVSFYFPPEIINNRINGALNQVRIFDNGVLLNGYNFQMTPGNHHIRIESGGFVIEGNYYFNGGQSYTIQPMLNMIVN